MKQFSLEEYLANPSRKVVTRDGRAVRIICTDFNNKEYPIVVEIQGEMKPATLTEEGMFFPLNGNSDNDLFFAPEKHEGWMHIYKHIDGHCEGDGVIYNTKEQCEVNQSSRTPYRFQHVAIAKIEWEE